MAISATKEGNRNALKHGLAASVRREPKLCNLAAQLAQAMADERPDSTLRHAAEQLALAFLDLYRIEFHKVTLLQRRTALTPERSKLFEGQFLSETGPDFEHAAAYLRAREALATVDRYERKALSRLMSCSKAYFLAEERAAGWTL